MPVVRRSRTLAAPPEVVWRLVADPTNLPRWWPKVGRVEGVEPGAFTKVHGTSKGRGLRADYRIVSPGDDAARLGGTFARRWALVVPDSPFERIVSSLEEVAVVGPADGGAVVTLEIRQKLRGLSRFGGFLARRGARRQLDEALGRLETLV